MWVFYDLRDLEIGSLTSECGSLVELNYFTTIRSFETWIPDKYLLIEIKHDLKWKYNYTYLFYTYNFLAYKLIQVTITCVNFEIILMSTYAEFRNSKNIPYEYNCHNILYFHKISIKHNNGKTRTELVITRVNIIIIFFRGEPKDNNENDY